jgi:CIC family chloride channel protein
MDQDTHHHNLVTMSLLAVAVGVVAAIGAWIFKKLIALVHNAVLLGQFGWDYTVTDYVADDPWGPGIILVPPLVAIIVAFLVKTWAPEAKGHGVPEVMDAIHYNEARMRWQVVVIKALASSLTIGSGGSAGREGPIIQMGAAMGANLGMLVKMPVSQRITLVAAGGGAGIAAAFNAPMGGILFAVELLLLSVNVRNLLPVSLACAIAIYLTRLAEGPEPLLNIQSLTEPLTHAAPVWTFVLFIPLGILVGILSWLFIRGLDKTEDLFALIPGGYYVQHILGMLMLGVMLYAMLKFTGHYYVEGVGYATISQILEGLLANPWFLLLLMAFKLAATCLTLGSGASGGVFSPSMYMGAALGAAFGNLCHFAIPDLGIPLATFALAGMAGTVAGATGALLTAIAMTFEMTLDYYSLLPVIVTSAVAWAMRNYLIPSSLYTIKLLRRGHVVPEGLQASVDASRHVEDVMSKDFVLCAKADQAKHTPGKVSVVEDDGAVIGALGPMAAPGDDCTKGYIVVEPGSPLIPTLQAMERIGASLAVVTRDPGSKKPEDIEGVITARELQALVGQTVRMLS